LSLVVFPFKSEPASVVLANIAIAASHARVGEVWAVGAADEADLPGVADGAAAIAAAGDAGIMVFSQERIGDLRPGKGDGMNTALRRAATAGHARVHFYDADITNFDHGWIDGAERAADRGYTVVRHRFPRAATDGMITWMVTRPMLAFLFPGTLLPRLGQPLGGEILLTLPVVESLVADPAVTRRSDWGIDTMLTYATSLGNHSLYEHHVADGKRHALYGSLGELRTMFVECLDAACSLQHLRQPLAHFDADPSAPVPNDLKATSGYDPQRTLGLLTEDWQEAEIELALTLPVAAEEVLANRRHPNFEFMDEAVWGATLRHLLEQFRLGEPAWESLAFRLWAMRVLHYTESHASLGYDHAIGYLEETIGDYETQAG
jgi:mannosylglycerate synthase